MPSSYSGVPSATQAPSPSPVDGGVPIGQLPIDGEPVNASTWSQILKVPLDWIAFLREPFAKATAWAQPIQKWKNARLQDRFLVDHMGFPSGRLFRFGESWMFYAPTVSVSGDLDPQKVWKCHLSGVNISVQGASDAAATNSPCIRLQGLDPSNCMVATQQPIMRPLTSIGAALTTEVRLSSGATPSRFAVGLYDTATSYASLSSSTNPGAWIFRSGTTNWQARTCDGASTTTVDTGVAPTSNVTQLLRVEWHGSGVADNSTSAFRFYIDDALVATITSTLPAATTTLHVAFGAEGSVGSNFYAYVSPVDFQMNR